MFRLHAYPAARDSRFAQHDNGLRFVFRESSATKFDGETELRSGLRTAVAEQVPRRERLGMVCYGVGADGRSGPVRLLRCAQSLRAGLAAVRKRYGPLDVVSFFYGTHSENSL